MEKAENPQESRQNVIIIFMRKIFLLSTIVMACLLVVSCNKEGVFNPKNKIDRIYYSYSTKYEVDEQGHWETINISNMPKYVSEIWHWEGNILKSISHYAYDGELRYTENFEYDGKRLISISSWDGEDRTIINYEKGGISSIDCYSYNERYASYEFSHDKGKISSIRTTFFSLEKTAVSPFSVNALRFFIPAINPDNIIKAMAKKSGKKDSKGIIETSTMKFEWSGKNVSKITFTYSDDEIPYTYEYIYDEKLNPFYGLFNIGEDDWNLLSLSKNNVTREFYREDDYYVEYNYTYTYNGKVPTSKSHTDIHTYTNTYNDYCRDTYTDTYYYEYK